MVMFQVVGLTMLAMFFGAMIGQSGRIASH
jgi:hypothetical protein